MSTARLTFLYPHLFRAARFGKSPAQRANLRCRKCPPNIRKPRLAAFSSSTPARQAVFERHGKAVEPVPPIPDVVQLPEPGKDPSKPPSFESSTDKKSTEKKEIAQEPQEAKDTKDAKDATPKESDKTEATPQEGSTVTGSPSPNPRLAATETKMQESGPMEAVLHMPPPDKSHHPHLSTPPYVHHFDSYTLVKGLEADGYSRAQAITVMKAIRGLLASNLDVAQDGLVSKSDVDNVRAFILLACLPCDYVLTNITRKRICSAQLVQSSAPRSRTTERSLTRRHASSEPISSTR